MFRFEELSVEEEEAIIERTAQAVMKYGLETASILLLKSMRPSARFGMQMGRIALSPLFIFLGNFGDELLMVYDKGVNVDKLIQRIEELREEKHNRINEEKMRLKSLSANQKETENDKEPGKKKGRFWRFFRRS